eukprot:8626869-Pyramimonas_sp.AAC.2
MTASEALQGGLWPAGRARTATPPRRRSRQPPAQDTRRPRQNQGRMELFSGNTLVRLLLCAPVTGTGGPVKGVVVASLVLLLLPFTSSYVVN